VDSVVLGTKLRNAIIGVVNEDQDTIVNLGFSSNSSNTNSAAIDIVNNSHYITSAFSSGTLPILSSADRLVFPTGNPAPDVQNLAEIVITGSNKATLGILSSGDALDGGGSAANRRVQLPWGGDTFDFNTLNADGQTIMQRAIEWAAGNGCDSLQSLLMLVVDGANPTAQESSRRTLLESWCYVVSTISAAEPQSSYDTFADNYDVVYVPSSVNYLDVANKLKLQPVGVVNEVSSLSAYLGFSSGTSGYNGTATELTDNTHYITTGLPLGNLDITTASTSLRTFVNTMAPGLHTLSTQPSATDPMIMTLDFGDELLWGGNAPDRRVMLPWGGSSTFDTATLTEDGLTILQRALEWAAMPPPPALIIAHWKLDETSGVTAVDSVGGHDATLTNGPNWVTGQVDGALDFDGGNDYAITSNNFTPPATGTVTFWMQVPGSPSTHGRILGLDDNWEIRHVDSATADGVPYGLVFDLGVSGVNAEFATTVPINTPGQWYHIAAAYDTGTNAYAVYIDGALHLSGTYPGSLAVPAANRLSLGTRTGSTQYFDGTLDDVRIYDGMLSVSEIADLYSAGNGGGPPTGTSNCSVAGSYRDDFNDRVWNGSNAGYDWSASPWLELGENDGATAGDVQIINDQSNYQLLIQGKDNGIEREVDLTDAVSATLSFDYSRRGLDNSIDYIAIFASSSGTTGPWTELPAPRIEGSGNDSNYLSYTRDISAYISTNTAIRMFSSNKLGDTEGVFFDNFQISCSP